MAVLLLMLLQLLVVNEVAPVVVVGMRGEMDEV